MVSILGDVEGTVVPVLTLVAGMEGLLGETSLLMVLVLVLELGEICGGCWEGEKDSCHCRRS